MPMSFAYRISKAGLNMMNRLYAEDFKKEGFTFLLLSPGVSLQFDRGICFRC